MRLREFVFGAALMTIAIVSVEANPPAISSDASRDEEMRSSEVANHNERQSDAEVNLSELLSGVPSQLVVKDKVLGSAYFNTLSILSRNNACSDFFGGPAASVDVFKQLIGRVQKYYDTTAIGISMSGKTLNISNNLTKTKYRLFERVLINANGPFYRKRGSQSDLPLPRIGTFEPNTREVRVLMFLHELGHIMKGEDGNWLLPNDGKDESLSRLNSQKIEGVCGRQIIALGKHDTRSEAQMSLAGKTKPMTLDERDKTPATNAKSAEPAGTIPLLKKN